VVELGRPEAVDACGPEPRNDIHLGDRAVPHDRRRRSALRLDVLQPTIEKLRHGVPLGALVPAVVDLGHELGSKALRFAWCPGRCGERTDSDPSSRPDRARLAPASGRAQSGECCPSPLPTVACASHKIRAHLWLAYLEEEPGVVARVPLSCGGSGIRTHAGSPLKAFQEPRIRPLCHPSARQVTPRRRPACPDTDHHGRGPAAQQTSPDEDRRHHITTTRRQASDTTRTPWLNHGRAPCARRGVDPTESPIVASGGLRRREHCSGRTSIGGAFSGTDVHPRLGRLGQPVGASPSQPRPPQPRPVSGSGRCRRPPAGPGRRMRRSDGQTVRRSDGQTVRRSDGHSSAVIARTPVIHSSAARQDAAASRRMAAPSSPAAG